MVRGPTNSPKDGIAALDGIIETDWAHSTFTMNWRFTSMHGRVRDREKRFAYSFQFKEVCLRCSAANFVCWKRTRNLKNKFREWSVSRDRFLAGLDKGKAGGRCTRLAEGLHAER